MIRHLVACLAVLCLTGLAACNTVTAAVSLPDPVIDEQTATATGEKIAVFAGGCFWGVEAVFEHVRGVKKVVSGYAGGSAATARYPLVSEGSTEHAESVRVIYDPSQITFGKLLRVFFSVAHDPTELNRQGPDVGTQYRSAIFIANEDQKRIAEAYIDQVNRAKVFRRPVVTQVVGSKVFYEAEPYHQDYAVHHPDQRYIVINDLPKVDNLRKQFPNLYADK